MRLICRIFFDDVHHCSSLNFILGVIWELKRKTAFSKCLRMPMRSGADEGNRTLYIQLGKLTFYR